MEACKQTVCSALKDIFLNAPRGKIRVHTNFQTTDTTVELKEKVQKALNLAFAGYRDNINIETVMQLIQLFEENTMPPHQEVQQGSAPRVIASAPTQEQLSMPVSPPAYDPEGLPSYETVMRLDQQRSANV